MFCPKSGHTEPAAAPATQQPQPYATTCNIWRTDTECISLTVLSVHTSRDALIAGEAGIRRIALELQARGLIALR